MIQEMNDFQSLGCKDTTKSAMAARVYLDLLNDKRVINLEKKFDDEFSLAYLRGERNGAIVVFVPFLTTQPMNMMEIQRIQKKLSDDSMSITLAICDNSSTVLYYQITAQILEKM